MSEVIIKLDNFRQFSCRGREKDICSGCRLRFLCLSERDKIWVLPEIIKQYKIKDFKSLIKYMFGEGKIPYKIEESRFGSSETRLVVKFETL